MDCLDPGKIKVRIIEKNKQIICCEFGNESNFKALNTIVYGLNDYIEMREL